MSFQACELKDLVQILGRKTSVPGDRVILFLGAGCSYSSGVPLAEDLASVWRLNINHQAWREGWDSAPGKHYGEIFDAAFHGYNERRGAVREAMQYARPGFGYYVLAKLIENSFSQPDHGPFKTILTTNFDDLLEQALTIHTNIRPQVIGLLPDARKLVQHVGAAAASWLSILKLHGDYRSSMLNSTTETMKATKAFGANIGSIIANNALIFIGYGGNDNGIASMFAEAIKRGHEPFSVYWVGNSTDNIVADSLGGVRRKFHVNVDDFDLLMKELQDELELDHVSLHRLSEFSEDYVSYLADPVRAKTMKVRSDDWSHYLITALSADDDKEGLTIFTQGIRLYKSCAPLLSAYAHFCKDKFQDYKKAEKYYELALSADGRHWRTHTHYATMLRDRKQRRDLVGAAKRCMAALDIHSGDINTKIIMLGIEVALGNLQRASDLANDIRFRPMQSHHRLEFNYYMSFLDGGEANWLEVRRLLDNGIRTPDCEYDFLDGVEHFALQDLGAITREMVTPPPNRCSALLSVLESVS